MDMNKNVIPSEDCIIIPSDSYNDTDQWSNSNMPMQCKMFFYIMYKENKTYEKPTCAEAEAIHTNNISY